MGKKIGRPLAIPGDRAHHGRPAVYRTSTLSVLVRMRAIAVPLPRAASTIGIALAPMTSIKERTMIDAILSDVDGTLIDNTALHVLAWQRAFRRIGRTIDANTILHAIGMGGDQLAPRILHEDASSEAVMQVQQFHGEEYAQKGLIEHAEVLPAVKDLLAALRGRGIRIALASSAKKQEFEHYTAMLGGTEMLDAVVTSEDVAASKPAPDVFATALERLGTPSHTLAIGDTIYDVQAAGKLNIPCICVLSGGIEREVLLHAGVAAVYDDPAALLHHLDTVLREHGSR
jgi:HAD superfamily hydrolase (TIGR01509 family)